MTTVTENRVGILMINEQPVHSELAQQLLDLILDGEAAGIYEAQVFHAPNTKREDIMAKVQAIAEKKEVDTLFVIGEASSVPAVEEAKKHGLHVIFLAVRDPIKQGLIESLEKPGGFASGVLIEDAPIEKLAALLKYLQPTVKSLLIPYHTPSKTTELKNRALKLAEILGEEGMTVYTVPIIRCKEAVLTTIKEHLPHIDAFLIMDGCYSAILQREIAYLFWDVCKLAIGCNIASISSGMAISYNGSISPLAVEGFKILRKFREEGIPLGEIPVTIVPDNREFIVNIDMLRRIGFPDEALEKLCSAPNIKVVRTWVHPPK